MYAGIKNSTEPRNVKNFIVVMKAGVANWLKKLDILLSKTCSSPVTTSSAIKANTNNEMINKTLRTNTSIEISRSVFLNEEDASFAIIENKK